MLLHARTVAIAVGARGAQVEQIAATIHARGNVTLDAAREALTRLVATQGEAALTLGGE
jgi:hypothetical protein